MRPHHRCLHWRLPPPVRQPGGARAGRESVDIFLNFADLTEQHEYDPGIQQQGYLFLTLSEDGAERQRALVEKQHAWGQTDIELLSGDETRKRFPYISPQVWQARFRAADGFLDPKAVTHGLALASQANILTGCAVTGFDIRGGRLEAVETTHGAIQTHTAVIACGPFSGIVASWAGVDLPVETVIRHKGVMPHVPEVPSWAPMTIGEDTGAHWRPALRGAYLLFTDPATPATPPAENVTPNGNFAFQLLDPTSPSALSRIAPFWNDIWNHGAAYWMLQAGQYTMTPDHRPLIGPTPIEGLYTNTGYSGHGVMGSPAGSRVLADVLAGKLSPLENAFRLDREFVPRQKDIL